MIIGTKRLGAHVQCSETSLGSCVHAVCWLQRGNELHYWYPSITIRPWFITATIISALPLAMLAGMLGVLQSM